MNHPRVRTASFLLGALSFALAGCRDRGHASADAAVDYVAIDVPAPADSAAVPLALDFSATGCAAFDPTVPRCSGEAPLTLAFTSVASAELTRFLWTFGDETPDSSERSPTHTYSAPGTYRVTLVGLSPRSGSIQQSHAGFVVVEEARPGAVCDVDAQCLANTSCWCGSLSPCNAHLTRGFCSVACDGGATCPGGTACVDFSTGGPASMSDLRYWRRSLCLPVCVDDTDCGPGFRCRNLRSGGGEGGWQRACFGSYPLEIGARCGDGQGRPADSDCASRQCADLGAFRRCSADCSITPCPDGTACALFGNGQRLCLAHCGNSAEAGVGLDASASDASDANDANDARNKKPTVVTTACDDDPLLACQTPGGTGPLAFAVSGAAASGTYCSPKRCATAEDCVPSGFCPTGGGSCQRGADNP